MDDTIYELVRIFDTLSRANPRAVFSMIQTALRYLDLTGEEKSVLKTLRGKILYTHKIQIQEGELL